MSSVLEKGRRLTANLPEHIPKYPARAEADLTAVDAGISSRVVYRHPIPWPSFYDPPTFPHEPGQHPEALRVQWRAWMQAWEAIADPLFGAEPDHEAVGEIFARLAHLIYLDVRFDPAFRRAMSLWAWSGYQVDADWDRGDDDDQDRRR
ncbi:MAG: hypothetical protein AAGA29_04910 [Planctomycetota bacterium]